MSGYTKEELIPIFVGIGMDEKFAAGTANNKKISEALIHILKETELINGCDKVVGNHFTTIATKLPPTTTKGLMETNRMDLYKSIINGDIKSTAQLNAALDYFKKESVYNSDTFNTACGVGVVVTTDDIKAIIDKVFTDNIDDINEKRYQVNGKIFGLISTLLPWANKGEVKTLFDEKFLQVCGPKLATDAVVNKGQAAQQQREAEEAKRLAAKKAKEAAAAQNPEGEAAQEDDFTIPPDNVLNGRQLDWAINTPAQLDTQKAATGGRVITRFPPEPNGYLHIGHAKAMMQNFGVADKYNGYCIMRFDDTNPDAEEQEYIDTILENLNALGHKPWKTTYSSDYFGELYDLAIKLIKKGKAYVCHQTKAEIQADREAGKSGGVIKESPYRNRSVEENLTLFENMKAGLYKENECTLRMKGDLTSSNPNLWDTVWYRIRYTPHPHTGNKWCIYPTYDYTHCIIDSLEFITYSMCTLEFENRRESYFWLLHELDLYKPKVWEYSRLNITNNVLSKRRLRALVEEGHVSGWDDPRLLTINGLRRRGIAPEAINQFIRSIGVTRTASTIPNERLLLSAREYLNPIATRAMTVVEPLRVVLTNLPVDHYEELEAPDHPSDPTKTHIIPFTRVIYIERDDFMIEPTKGYIRLAPGRTAHLKNAYNITVTGYKTDNDGNVTELEATVDVTNAIKPQAKLHFVAQPRPGQEPQKAELRIYSELFKSAEPMLIKDWQSDLNPNSLVVKHGYIDNFLVEHANTVGKQYQFERVGYYIIDPDTDFANKKYVFNQTCTLRESKF